MEGKQLDSGIVWYSNNDSKQLFGFVRFDIFVDFDMLLGDNGIQLEVEGEDCVHFGVGAVDSVRGVRVSQPVPGVQCKKVNLLLHLSIVHVHSEDTCAIWILDCWVY